MAFLIWSDTVRGAPLQLGILTPRNANDQSVGNDDTSESAQSSKLYQRDEEKFSKRPFSGPFTFNFLFFMNFFNFFILIF